jgi:tetratricopeptide (TPR) repeat protein
MNYFIRFSFISLLFIFLHSCSQTPTKLKTAEQLMDTRPDSALKLLRSIKPTLFTSSPNKALYALLYSQAMDKNEIKVESDSLISIATAYYDTSEPDRAGYAWFYKSRCANNRGDAKMQADDLMKAQEYAEQTLNNKLKGLVYTEIGNMYGTQRQFYRSIFYLKEAYKLFIRVNDYRNSTLCLINIGYKYLYTTKAKKSIYYMLQAQQMATHCNDSLIDITITRHLGGAYYQLNNFQKAIDYLYKVRPSNNSYYDNNKLYILANIYSKLNKTDSVKHYLKKVNELFDMAPSYYQLWMTVYEKEQNVHAALYYSKKIAASTDSL